MNASTKLGFNRFEKTFGRLTDQLETKFGKVASAIDKTLEKSLNMVEAGSGEGT